MLKKYKNAINPQSLGPITHENYFLFTKAIYVTCAEPTDTPDYISETGSSYWIGSDDSGEFVIRQSDHWCQYYVNDIRKMKRVRARIRSCAWNIIIPPPLLNTEIMRCGKCYISDFSRIVWRTKKRYEIIV